MDQVLTLFPLFPQLLRLGRLDLVPSLLPVVELGEAVADDGDGQGDDEHPEDGAEAAEHLAHPGHRADVSVTHLAGASASKVAVQVSSVMILHTRSARHLDKKPSSNCDSKLSFHHGPGMLSLVTFHPISS